MSAPICFVDIESDGIHPDRKAWEIAIVRREPDGRETEWQAFVDIDLSTTPDGFGLGVGKFYDRHPLGRRLANLADRNERWTAKPPLSAEHAAHRVAERTHGAHIVGAVPSFDTYTLDRLLRANGLIPAWHYHIICAEVLAVGYLAAKGQVFAPPYSSNDLTEALGIEPATEEVRHTAMGDVRWAMRMYDAVMGSAS